MLFSVFGKILGWVILIKERHVFCNSGLEFGFKEDVSTTYCSVIFQKSERFNNNNEYTVLLDSSKAFNLVEYRNLFRVLLS